MKKRIIALILAVLMTTALCACGGGKTEQAAPETSTNAAGSTGEKLIGGEITVGIAADLDTSLDPHVSSASAGTREVLFNIFEGLVKPDSDGNILPAIANEFVVIIKESAIAYTIGVPDLMAAVNDVRGAASIIMEPLLVATAVYFCLCFPTSKIIAYFERRMSRGDKR